jgi:hypothetical protein
MKAQIFCVTVLGLGLAAASAFASSATSRIASTESSDAAATVADASSTAKQMQGTWAQPCQRWNPSDPATADDTWSYFASYTFKGSEFIWSQEAFSDSECKNPLAKLVATGFFKVGDPVPDIEGAYNFDVFEQFHLHTLLDSSKRAFEYCKGGNTPLTSVAECSSSDLFQIIRIEGDKLREGRITDDYPATSSNSRPSYLYSMGYKRVS